MKYFENFGHFCSVKYDEALEKYLNELSWLKHMIVIDSTSPLTTEYYSSHSSIINSTKEHLKKHPNTIHPFSTLKFIIECYMIFVFGCGLIYTPLLYMVYVQKDGMDNSFGNLVIVYFVKLSCIVDMILRFYTGHVDWKKFKITLDKRQIARKYLCGLFVFDVLTNLPFFIGLLMHYGPEDPEFHLIKLTTLFRIVRLPAFVSYSQRILLRFKVDDKYLEIFKMLAYWACLIHWAACLHMAPGIIVAKFHTGVKVGAWYENETFKNKDSFGKYIICLFKAVKTIMGTGYLTDLSPTMYFDKVYASILAIVGRVYLCITLAYMFQLIRSVKSSMLKYDEVIVQLNKYTASNRLNKSTCSKLKNNYDYMFCKRYFNEREILETVSMQLRQEIMVHDTRQLVQHSPFFENLPSTLVIRIISVLTSELFFENDMIFNMGDAGASIYFITSGSVVFYSPSDREVCHYSDGDYFGEMSFISDVDYRFCKAIALETTECYKLDREDFYELVTFYPDLLQKVEALALERMENIFMLEQDADNHAENVGYVPINQRRHYVRN